MKVKKRYQELLDSIANAGDNAVMSRIQIINDCCRILSQFLYDYQVDACRAAAIRMLSTLDPLLISMATGGGKSWVVVGLSYMIRRLTLSSGKDKKVLMICPSPELVKQNTEKLSIVGFEPSIYCTKLGIKEVEGDIIVGTPISIRNGLDDMNNFEFSAFWLDECQHVTPVIKEIVSELKARNPNLREVGLTATPHRKDTGYIYGKHIPLGKVMDPSVAKDPYYAELVYEIKADKLIEMGKLVPPTFEEVGLSFDTDGLVKNKKGEWTKESENAVFVNGKNILNETIVKDILKRTKARKSVIIFAQNIAHSEMIKGYFGEVAKVTHSNMNDKERDIYVSGFKAGKVKYMINVDSLTTGFDSPITDTVVFLRATESPALFEQMLGRGLRINPDKRAKKRDCRVLDYAQNFKRHCPHGDPFNPIIKLAGEKERDIAMVEVTCPTCFRTNQFRSAMQVENGFLDDCGYLRSPSGEMVMARSKEELLPIAGHLGSQCMHYDYDESAGRMVRCSQKWSKNVCGKCDYLNCNSDAFCIRCESPLSNKAYQLESMMFGKTGGGRLEDGTTCSQVVEYRFIKRNGRNNWPMLLLAVKCKEVPYLTVTFDEKYGRLYQVVEPIERWISIWLKPKSSKVEDIKAWNEFQNFFFDGEVDYEDIEHAETIRDLRYLNHWFNEDDEKFHINKYR